GFAETVAVAADLSDPKVVTDQVVEVHSVGHEIASSVSCRETHGLEYLGLDQCQVYTCLDRMCGPGSDAGEVAISLEPDAGDRRHTLDRECQLHWVGGDKDLLDPATHELVDRVYRR